MLCPDSAGRALCRNRIRLGAEIWGNRHGRYAGVINVDTDHWRDDVAVNALASDFFVVGQAIEVGVALAWVEATGAFEVIGEAIAVGIGLPRIGEYAVALI